MSSRRLVAALVASAAVAAFAAPAPVSAGHNTIGYPHWAVVGVGSPAPDRQIFVYSIALENTLICSTTPSCPPGSGTFGDKVQQVLNDSLPQDNPGWNNLCNQNWVTAPQDCNIQYVYQGDTVVFPCYTAPPSGVVVICSPSDYDAVAVAAGQHSGAGSAGTWYTWLEAGNHINSASIFLNGASPAFLWDGKFTRGVLCHEFGHSLGFGNTGSNGDSDSCLKKEWTAATKSSLIDDPGWAVGHDAVTMLRVYNTHGH